MRFDVRLYHKSVNVISNILPSEIFGMIGRLLFRIMMLYLRIYMGLLRKTRERFDSLLDYELSRRFRRYVSIDLYKFPIAVKNPTIEFVQADITRAPFKDEVFDVILCISTIEHIENDIGAMMEMKRLLKYGDKLYVSAPLGSQFYNEESIRKLQINGLVAESYEIKSLSNGKKLCTMILTKESLK